MGNVLQSFKPLFTAVFHRRKKRDHTAFDKALSCCETGPVVYFAENPHGSNDCAYLFNYKKVKGFWRAYVLRTPELCGRDDGTHLTHRVPDKNGGFFISWDHPVTSFEDMELISHHWANHIQTYIATGAHFGQGGN